MLNFIIVQNHLESGFGLFIIFALLHSAKKRGNAAHPLRYAGMLA
jgi:hypothetical protein